MQRKKKFDTQSESDIDIEDDVNKEAKTERKEGEGDCPASTQTNTMVNQQHDNPEAIEEKEKPDEESRIRNFIQQIRHQLKTQMKQR